MAGYILVDFDFNYYANHNIKHYSYLFDIVMLLFTYYYYFLTSAIGNAILLLLLSSMLLTVDSFELKH